MYCPNCGHKQVCPCKSCKRSRIQEYPGSRKDALETEKIRKPWKWNKGFLVSCGNCGLTNAADWWADLEYTCYEAMKKEHG